MKKTALIVITLFSILLAACSPAAAAPTQSIPPTQAAVATKAPSTNPTTPPAAATLPPAQPTQPAPTATKAPSTSNRPAVPAEFAAKVNPLTASASVISDGKAEYNASCTSCHGDKADGNGRNSSMTPKPSNLLLTVKEASDAYLYWRISEGGRFAPFNSRMPSFKGELNETQIWQVIVYLQSLK